MLLEVIVEGSKPWADMIQWKVNTCHLEKDNILLSEETESRSPFMPYRSLSASKVIHVRILGQKNYLSKVWFMHPLAAFCFVFQNWWKALLVFSTVYNFISEEHSFCFCFLKDMWSFLGTSFILSVSHPISMCWMMVLVIESYSVPMRRHLNMNKIFYFAVTENKHRILVIQ